MEYATDARCPLDGVRVLDLSRLIAGNILTHQLADFGAEVIKIEPPGRGDDIRAWRVKGVSTYWKVYGRNKKSVALNLREERGKELLLQLVETAGMLVENFRPGTLEAMGLGPDILHRRNPKLVLVRVSGWGQEGPYRNKPGFGSLIEALSGFAAMNGFGDRPPVLPPLALADCIAGLQGAFAAMVALREVEVKSGRGQIIDLALFDPIFSILGPQAANYRQTGEVEPRLGSGTRSTAPRNVYGTKDGKWVALSASMQGMAERFLRAIGKPELIEDPRFRTNTDRVANREALDAIVAEWIGERSLAENLATFEAAEVTVGPVADISDLMQHPFIRGRGLIVEMPDPEMDGLPMHAVTPRLSGTAGAIRRPAPEVGEHTDSILGAIGVGAAELARLKQTGVL
jgi:crotonobetainyl-CoA:carnitine CoA-transferase CaiB-like acyl-CoA transferase